MDNIKFHTIPGQHPQSHGSSALQEFYSKSQLWPKLGPLAYGSQHFKMSPHTIIHNLSRPLISLRCSNNNELYLLPHATATTINFLRKSLESFLHILAAMLLLSTDWWLNLQQVSFHSRANCWLDNITRFLLTHRWQHLHFHVIHQTPSTVTLQRLTGQLASSRSVTDLLLTRSGLIYSCHHPTAIHLGSHNLTDSLTSLVFSFMRASSHYSSQTTHRISVGLPIDYNRIAQSKAPPQGLSLSSECLNQHPSSLVLHLLTLPLSTLLLWQPSSLQQTKLLYQLKENAQEKTLAEGCTLRRSGLGGIKTEEMTHAKIPSSECRVPKKQGREFNNDSEGKSRKNKNSHFGVRRIQWLPLCDKQTRE